MLEIISNDLHWLDGSEPGVDLCSHGTVEVMMGGERFDDGEICCTSAAAMFLLRTLERNHDSVSRVSEKLLPHCGHSMFDVGEGEEVTIIECPNGFDWSVKHIGDRTKLEFENARVFELAKRDWQTAVMAFADQVENFYRQSVPRKFPDDFVEAGFDAFWKEWKRHRP